MLFIDNVSYWRVIPSIEKLIILLYLLLLSLILLLFNIYLPNVIYAYIFFINTDKSIQYNYFTFYKL